MITDWIAVIILGIVEGITEFLPVSSTGHMLLVECIKGMPRESDLFLVVIQAFAVIAVIPLFPERMNQFLFKWREPATRDYLLKFFTAFAITGAGGLLLEKMHFKLPEKALPVALALAIGGVLFLLVERWIKGRPVSNEITWNIAIAVGLGQLVAAIFPGSSRSGTTILLALMFGLSRPAATEFTFLVGIPTMLAASGLKIFKALHHPAPGAAPEHWGLLLLGGVVSAIVSFIVVKWMLRYVQTHTFEIFGWYRILAGGLLLLGMFWR
ncbi:MAG: undecaprenyl-diphosphate phosphatase [Verrucomicrobiota bacterium]